MLQEQKKVVAMKFLSELLYVKKDSLMFSNSQIEAEELRKEIEAIEYLKHLVGNDATYKPLGNKPRLIDASKLHYIRVWINSGYDENNPDVVVFAKEINKAPTIEAIPVEWIEKKLEENYWQWPDARSLIKDWREHEKEHSDD